ncbi:MAG: hypothetical protein ABEK17_04625 [Candidatus Aenigmatarchaeota archaeon]
MSDFLVKEMEIRGRYEKISDKYSMKSHNVPNNHKIWNSYRWVNDKIEERGGHKVESEKIQHLPHIKDGLITGSNIASCYEIDDYIIGNAIISEANGLNNTLKQKIQMAGKPENEEGIDGTFNILRNGGPLWQYKDLWVISEGEIRDMDLPMETLLIENGEDM